MNESTFWTPAQTVDESGVAIHTDDGLTFEGWSTLPALGIIAVVFPEDAAPLLPTYESVDLTFTGSGELDITIQRAHMFHCRFVSGQITYVFEVPKGEWKHLRESLRPRRADRIEPECMVAVNLTTPAGTARGTIDDISQTGLSLRVKPADEHFFLHPGALALKFQIPANRSCLLMIAHLRYRTRDLSGLVRCGFEFDAECTEGFEEQRALIAKYVSSRAGNDNTDGGFSLAVEPESSEPQAKSLAKNPSAPKTPMGRFVRQEAIPLTTETTPNAPVQETPVQQAPVQQAPVQQAPVQQAPVQQAPVQETPASPPAPQAEEPAAPQPVREDPPPTAPRPQGPRVIRREPDGPQ